MIISRQSWMPIVQSMNGNQNKHKVTASLTQCFLLLHSLINPVFEYCSITLNSVLCPSLSGILWSSHYLQQLRILSSFLHSLTCSIKTACLWSYLSYLSSYHKTQTFGSCFRMNWSSPSNLPGGAGGCNAVSFLSVYLFLSLSPSLSL